MGNEIKTTPFFEKAQFLIGITLLGGYVNTYAFIARGGNMVSFHTGNQIRCGMSLAYGNLSDFVFYLMPILMCSGRHSLLHLPQLRRCSSQLHHRYRKSA